MRSHHLIKASLFNDMKNWISKYESNKEKKEQLKSQIELLSNELKQLKEQLEENEKTINTLFTYINVSSEEAYYQSYEQYQLYHQQLARFKDLTAYLENQNFSYEDSSNLSEKQLLNWKKKMRFLLNKLMHITISI